MLDAPQTILANPATLAANATMLEVPPVLLSVALLAIFLAGILCGICISRMARK